MSLSNLSEPLRARIRVADDQLAAEYRIGGSKEDAYDFQVKVSRALAVEIADALDAAEAHLERERKARKAVERVIADEVVRKRTNLAAVVASLEIELAASRQREARLLEALTPTDETRDYLTRTIATIRNHRDADNCWPQWANYLADEVERMWVALAGEEGAE